MPRLFILLLILFSNIYAIDNKFTKVYKLYKSAKYKKALVILKTIKGNKTVNADKYYFIGLCHARTGNFKKASINLKKAISLGNKTKEIFYEYGQANYAENNFEVASKAFKKSISKKYKIVPSLYYIAYIAQTMNQFIKAKKYYLKIIKKRKTAGELLPVAYFQLAEVHFAENQNKKNIKTIVKKHILPLLKKALKHKLSNSLKTDIEKRKMEILKAFGMDPNVMKNGKVLPPKKYNINFSQLIKYDTNVTLTPESSQSTATNYSSAISDTNLFMNYRFVFSRRFIVKPELSSTFNYYSNRDYTSVYENDGYILTPSIKTNLEHKIGKSMASFIFNLSYSRIARNADGEGTYKSSTRSFSFDVGERFNIFKAGATTIKLTYKISNNVSDGYDGNIISGSINQAVNFKNGQILAFVFDSEFTGYDETYNDSSTYTLRINYIKRNLFKSVDLKLGHTLTYVDTGEQNKTRGAEIKLNPYFALTKKLTQRASAVLSYDFMNNSSKDEENYAYSKHIVGLQFKYSY